MKKILMSIFVMILLSVSVFAANGNSASTAPSPGGMSVTDNKSQPEVTQLKLSTMLQERLRTNGLENAMIHVGNADAQDRLMKAMEKIQTQNQERLQNLQGLEISEEGDDAFIAEGTKQSGLKYLSFVKFERTHRYQLYEDGSMLKEQNRFDWLFEEE
jgi:hypothetical protein